MKIQNIKKGQVINHSRYGKATVSEVYKTFVDNKLVIEGLLLDNLLPESVTLLNKDRQIKNMPNRGNVITRVYEDNLNLLS